MELRARATLASTSRAAQQVVFVTHFELSPGQFPGEFQRCPATSSSIFSAILRGGRSIPCAPRGCVRSKCARPSCNQGPKPVPRHHRRTAPLRRDLQQRQLASVSIQMLWRYFQQRAEWQRRGCRCHQHPALGANDLRPIRQRPIAQAGGGRAYRPSEEFVRSGLACPKLPSRSPENLISVFRW